MRTLQGQGLNNNNGLFKNEATAGANDGTQLLENCGLADVYYAMLQIMQAAGISVLETPENRSSQILQALNILYADKNFTNSEIQWLAQQIRDNFSGTNPQSNNNLMSAINQRFGLDSFRQSISNYNLDTAIQNNFSNRENSNTDLRKRIDDNFSYRENSNTDLRNRIDNIGTGVNSLIKQKIYRDRFTISTNSKLLIPRQTLINDGININNICRITAVVNDITSVVDLPVSYMGIDRSFEGFDNRGIWFDVDWIKVGSTYDIIIIVEWI